MASDNRPTKTWKESKRGVSSGDNEIEMLWDSCLGSEGSDVKPRTSAAKNNPVESKKIEEIVSIGCRRHKKRLNVEKSWLKTCKWLCPKCYESMCETDRQMYAPGNLDANVGKMIPGKRVIVSKKKEEKEQAKEIAALEKENAGPNVEAKNEVKRNKKEQSFISPALMALLPEWSMTCQKCGKTAPVHRSYIDNTSAIICPECSSKMTKREIREYNSWHRIANSQIVRIREKVSETPKKIPDVKPMPPRRRPIVIESASDIATGGCYSNKHIMQMSVKELSDAVKNGKLSKVRAKIELGRRRKSDYYSSMPDMSAVPNVYHY